LVFNDFFLAITIGEAVEIIPFYKQTFLFYCSAFEHGA